MLLERTNQIYEYKILQASNDKRLATEVQQYIALGWEPHGSLVIEVGEGTTHFYQPIVKYVRR